AALAGGLANASFPPAAAAEVAAHWSAAGDLPAALAAGVRAGELAARVYAFAAADEQFEGALGLWGQVPADARPAGVGLAGRVEQAAEAAGWTGRQERAVELSQRACVELVGTDPKRMMVALERLGRYHWEAGDSAASLSAYRQARDLLPADDFSVARAR